MATAILSTTYAYDPGVIIILFIHSFICSLTQPTHSHIHSLLYSLIYSKTFTDGYSTPTRQCAKHWALRDAHNIFLPRLVKKDHVRGALPPCLRLP